MASTIVADQKSSTGTGIAYPAKAYAAQSAASGLVPASIRRREPGPTDVQIDILFCGVCHSDLHQARNEWENMMPTVYPCVPGHEIVGRVVKAGSAVHLLVCTDGGKGTTDPAVARSLYARYIGT